MHDSGDGRGLIAKLARRGRGLPARVVPLEVHHPASIGIDVLLAALAYGASQVVVLATPKEAAEYGEALTKQMGFAQTIVTALGYGGTHFNLLSTDKVVEIDKLVAPQRTINRDYAQKLRARFPTTPSVEDLIEICLSPEGEPEPCA